MLVIHLADPLKDYPSVRELFSEYLYWANDLVEENFGIFFDIPSMIEVGMKELDIFSPLKGRLLLVDYDRELAGIACMKHMRDQIGEIKRMYIRETFRGKRLERALLHRLLEEAGRLAIYPCIWTAPGL